MQVIDFMRETGQPDREFQVNAMSVNACCACARINCVLWLHCLAILEIGGSTASEKPSALRRHGAALRALFTLGFNSFISSALEALVGRHIVPMVVAAPPQRHCFITKKL